jgi:hypothetical protein
LCGVDGFQEPGLGVFCRSVPIVPVRGVLYGLVRPGFQTVRDFWSRDGGLCSMHHAARIEPDGAELMFWSPDEGRFGKV